MVKKKKSVRSQPRATASEDYNGMIEKRLELLGQALCDLRGEVGRLSQSVDSRFMSHDRARADLALKLNQMARVPERPQPILNPGRVHMQPFELRLQMDVLALPPSLRDDAREKFAKMLQWMREGLREQGLEVVG